MFLLHILFSLSFNIGCNTENTKPRLIFKKKKVYCLNNPMPQCHAQCPVAEHVTTDHDGNMKDRCAELKIKIQLEPQTATLALY